MSQATFNSVVFLGWLPFVAWMFRARGPRQATLVAVFGSCAFLVGLMLETPPPSRVQFLKSTVTGAGILLGVALFDRRALAGARPRWCDAPAVAYALLPPVGLISCGWVGAWDSVDMVLQRSLCWLVPYAAGRLYFGRDDGPREVAVAVVVTSLCLAPVCLFESIMGPRWYVSGLVYGTHYHAGMVERLGGWRPEAFFNDGIALASWMALGSSMAFWLWLGRGWRPLGSPAWLPPLVLVASTVLCRGVYGYINLALGLAAALLTQTLRTRWVIVGLLLVAPVYMAARVSGTWDARALARLGDRVVPGRGDTVAVRLGSEDQILANVLGRDPVLGFGNHLWHLNDLQGTSLTYWPDGRWVRVFWEGGVLGLAAFFSALYLFPAGMALSRPHRRPDRAEAGASAWGLAAFLAVHMIDSLQNASEFMPTALAAGSVVGWAVNRRAPRAVPDPGRARPRENARPRGDRESPRAARAANAAGGSDLAPVAGVLALACLLYVPGHGLVRGQEGAKLVGGLGAGLFFAAAGAAGAWASGRVRLPRLAAYGLLFAALGVSFNLALHPGVKALASADILQGMALCGMAVAATRVAFGGGGLADSVLAVAALAVHFLLRPSLPDFPGSQYLFAGTGGDGGLSLFPLCPWLTLAVLGARASRESVGLNLTTAALAALAAGFLAWSDPGGAGFVKFPMNPPYALLSCSAVALSFALASAISSRGLLASGAGWLGRRWLIYFYVHFAVAAALSSSGIGSPWAVWPSLALASLAGTWATSRAFEPLRAWFLRPAPWVILLGVIAVAGVTTFLPRTAVSGLAGFAGLAFAAQYDTLAVRLAGTYPDSSRTHSRPRAPRPGPDDVDRLRDGDDPVGDPATFWRRESLTWADLGRNSARLGLALTLLASPELIDRVFRPDAPGLDSTRARPPGADARRVPPTTGRAVGPVPRTGDAPAPDASPR